LQEVNLFLEIVDTGNFIEKYLLMGRQLNKGIASVVSYYECVGVDLDLDEEMEERVEEDGYAGKYGQYDEGQDNHYEIS
jgi:hypothetical protein